MSFRYNDIVYSIDKNSSNYNKIGRVRSVYAEDSYVEFFDFDKKEFYTEFQKHDTLQLMDMKNIHNKEYILAYMPECHSIPLNYPIHIGSTVVVDSVDGFTFYVHNNNMGKCLYGIDVWFCMIPEVENKEA